MNRACALGFLALLAACDRAEDGPAPSPKPTQLPASKEPAGIAPGADPGQKERAAGDGRIAFVRNGRALWTMKPDGSDAREIVPADGDAWLGHPAWSPNRAWIAFAWDRRAEENLQPRNLWLVKPDGSGLRQVTPEPRAGLALEGPRTRVRGTAVALLPGGRLGMEGFTVCAGGREGTARTGPGGRFEVDVPATTTWLKVAGWHGAVRYSGAVLQRFKAGEDVLLGDVLLTTDGADDRAEHPAWSPDGRHLYYLQSTPAPASKPRPMYLRKIRLDGAASSAVFREPEGSYGGPAILDGKGERAWLRHWLGRVSIVDLEHQREMERWEPGGLPKGGAALARDGRVLVQIRDPRENRDRLIFRDDSVLLDRPAGAIGALDFSPDGGSIVLELEGRLQILEIAAKALRPVGPEDAGDPAWGGR